MNGLDAADLTYMWDWTQRPSKTSSSPLMQRQTGSGLLRSERQVKMPGGTIRGRGKVRSADAVPCSGEAQREGVELTLSLLEGSSLPNTSCLASPRHPSLSGRSSGCLAFQGSDKTKKVFQDIVILPSSLTTICCPRRPATLRFA